MGVISVSSFILATSLTFSWFDNRVKFTPNITGSAIGSYFNQYDDATGTWGKSSTNPYVISTARQLYNLSWLQYLGNFNSDSDSDSSLDTYYFEIDKNLTYDLDMSGWTIPAIGDTSNPFIGNFNGNSKVISNLTISNSFADFNAHPYSVTSSNYVSSSIIGLFGVVGQYESTSISYDSTVNKITNVYVDSLTVKNNSSSNVLAGFLAGYVNASIQYCGVGYAHFDFKTGTTNISSLSDNVSNYTLIGYYNSDDYTWTDRPGDVGYGDTLNFLEMMQRMVYIHEKSWSTPTFGSYNGFNTSKKSTNLAKYMYLPLSITNDITEDFYSSNTSETIAKNNIGFITGAESKILSRSVTDFSSKNVYKLKDSSTKTYEIIASENTSNGLDNDIYETVYNSFFKSSAIYGLRYNNQIDNNSWIEIDNTSIAGLTNQKITIPMNTVYFTAQKSGTAKIIYCSQSSTSALQRGVSIYLITRTSKDSTYKYYTSLTNPKSVSVTVDSTKITSGYGMANYQGGMSGVTSTIITSIYENTFSDGTTSITYNGYDSSASSYSLVYSYDWYTLNGNEDNASALNYVEIPLVEGYEYAFGEQNNSNGMIIYMDIGQNGNTSSEKELAKIDFVYKENDKLVAITESNWESYQSDVLFTITGQETASTSGTYYFRRVQNVGVLYYYSSSSLTITSLGSGNNYLASDSSCDSKSE